MDLVRLAGARLALYRELSCDESVVERAQAEDLVSALAKLAPDHIAVTGDLVNLSLSNEFEPALQWLSSLGDPRDDSYIRICFAQDAARLSQALDRLDGAIRKL